MEKQIMASEADLEILKQIVMHVECARQHHEKSKALSEVLLDKWGIKAELGQLMKIAKETLTRPDVEQARKAGQS